MLCWANTVVLGSNTMVFWTNCLIMGSNTVVFEEHTVVLKANTMVLVGDIYKWSKCHKVKNKLGTPTRAVY